jgi:hypothetical protein
MATGVSLFPLERYGDICICFPEKEPLYKSHWFLFFLVATVRREFAKKTKTGPTLFPKRHPRCGYVALVLTPDLLSSKTSQTEKRSLCRRSSARTQILVTVPRPSIETRRETDSERERERERENKNRGRKQCKRCWCFLFASSRATGAFFLLSLPFFKDDCLPSLSKFDHLQTNCLLEEALCVCVCVCVCVFFLGFVSIKKRRRTSQWSFFSL